MQEQEEMRHQAVAIMVQLKTARELIKGASSSPEELVALLHDAEDMIDILTQ